MQGSLEMVGGQGGRIRKNRKNKRKNREKTKVKTIKIIFSIDIKTFPILNPH